MIKRVMDYLEYLYGCITIPPNTYHEFKIGIPFDGKHIGVSDRMFKLQILEGDDAFESCEGCALNCKDSMVQTAACHRLACVNREDGFAVIVKEIV